MRTDRRWWEIPFSALPGRNVEGLHSSGSALERKFWVALGLYAALGLLVWFTMGEGKVLVHGRPVELKLIPLLVIGGLVLRTLIAHQAARIRREDGASGKR